MRAIACVLALLILTSAAVPAYGSDWVASKLRGIVLVLVEGEWQPLARGDRVDEGQVVRTLHNGRLRLARGDESIDLAPQTQIKINEHASGNTVVSQYFGQVLVEADVRDREHFEVRTAYLVAVVKGTRFSVGSGRSGAEVRVQRGLVGVVNNKTHFSVTASAGQKVRLLAGRELELTGRGLSAAATNLPSTSSTTGVGELPVAVPPPAAPEPPPEKSKKSKKSKK